MTLTLLAGIVGEKKEEVRRREEKKKNREEEKRYRRIGKFDDYFKNETSDLLGN